MAHNKFESNSINKQNEAYKVSFAKRQFAYSCERCCSQNLRRGDCSRCPVKEAHVRALQEITEGKRKFLDPNYPTISDSLNKTVTVSKNGRVTITLSIEFN